MSTTATTTPEIIGANGRSYGLPVHQATGMVAAQANCSVAVALDLIVDYAEHHQCTVDETARDVVERRLRFRG